ncbi:MAG: dephospho-CoA kinase [Alphaproteobacteria bacterium]|nr:MAG: dephospho-CoA kinase [Alphaproteobacteria bacterium]
MIVLALTGSIGMGKSTTGAMFRELGIPVHDADDAVHALYSGQTALEIEKLFPGTVADGVVDRARLGAAVLADPDAMRRLEALVHPKVRAAEEAFLEGARAEGAALVVLDIPLLFETGGEARVDGVIVVSCPPDEQRRRVLARPGMTEAKFAAILSRQVPDAVKRARADFVVDTGQGMEVARRQVAAIVDNIRNGRWRPKGGRQR